MASEGVVQMRGEKATKKNDSQEKLICSSPSTFMPAYHPELTGTKTLDSSRTELQGVAHTI